MKALVIGGGGFLGSAIVRMLHDRGHEAAVLGRSSYPHLFPYVRRFFQGDIRRADAVRNACEGIDVVFHVAAKAGIWGPRREFRSINVDGTRNVIAACRAAGVRKLVFTSSPSVVFGDQPLCGVDESHPYPSRYLAEYPASKAAAERMVLAANSSDLATVALRPHLVFGPGDPHLFPRIIARAKSGGLVQIGDGKNLVDISYVENAALAHVLAADSLDADAPCAGRVYFISQGEPVCLWPWLNDILDRVGISRVTRRISYQTARRAGAVCEVLYRALPSSWEPPMTRFLAGQLAKSHYFNISAAKQELGYEPKVSTEEGVRRLVEWLRDGTMLRGMKNVESTTADLR